MAQKAAIKVPEWSNLVSKAQKHSGANGIILQLVCTSSAKTGEDFGVENGSKSARMAQLWEFR